MAKGVMNSEEHRISALVQDVQTNVDNCMRKAYNDVNATTVFTYWQVGRRIVEEEQHGEYRAEYGRGTKYHVYGMNVALPDGNVALPDGNVALPDGNVALSDANVALPDSNVALTGGNVGLLGSNVGLPGGNVGLPNPNVGLRRKRYSKNELRELVLAFCTQWRTAEEIALYVGRDLVYIRDRVLPQMSDVIEKNVRHTPPSTTEKSGEE